MASPNNQHFDTIYPLLPPGLKAGIDDLLSRATRESTVRHTLDQFLRFSLGRSLTEHDPDSSEDWHSQRTKAMIAFSNLSEVSESKPKRALEDLLDEQGSKSKKIKLELNEPGHVDDTPLYALNSLSVISPIRKKVNVVIHKRTVRFVNAATGVHEASIRLDSITRAFLVPTTGKSKPHWTVIILTSADQNQIIFGIDAIASSSLVTVATSGSPQTHPKGTETKAFLKEFLSHLPSRIPAQEPISSAFRSASGEPFVDAYLRAKEGHVFFFNDGLLFGEKKPCVWIPLQEVKSIRTLSATGRSFSIFVTHCKEETQKTDDENVEEEEVEFSLVDGKHQDAVSQWIRENRDKFGLEIVDCAEPGPHGKERDINGGQPVGDEETPEKKDNANSSDEDSDYETDSESDGGSPVSSSSGAGDNGDNGPDARDEESEGDDSAEEEHSLDPNKHPLLAPGVVPRMSKAVMDEVVRLVEGDVNNIIGEGSGQVDELEEEDSDQLA